MRVFKILFLFLLSANTFAQVQLSSDLATEFVHRKTNELNIKIWNAVHSAEIVAYRNDSLASILSSTSLRKETSLVSKVMISNPANPNDPYDLIEKITVFQFDSSSMFEGINLYYSKIMKNRTIKFTRVSLAPQWKPMTESGIDLGVNTLFHVKIDDVRELLGQEYEFYESLFTLRASLGDFINPYYYPFDDVEQLDEEISYYNTWHSQHYIQFQSKQDSIMGYHFATIPVFLASILKESGLNLFQDKKLRKAYLDVESQLMDSISVIVPNPENPGDPYDLVAKTLYVFFDLNSVKDIDIFKKRKDFIIDLKKSCYTLNGSAIEINACNRHIYFSLKDSKHLLKPQDRTVLETLLKELIAQD